MPDLSRYPSRVSRAVAMELLAIEDGRTFRKVVDANPDLRHKLPGEKRAKYLTTVIGRLLSPGKMETGGTPVLRNHGVQPAGRNESPKSKVQSPKSDGGRGGTKISKSTL